MGGIGWWADADGRQKGSRKIPEKRCRGRRAVKCFTSFLVPREAKCGANILRRILRLQYVLQGSVVKNSYLPVGTFSFYWVGTNFLPKRTNPVKGKRTHR